MKWKEVPVKLVRCIFERSCRQNFQKCGISMANFFKKIGIDNISHLSFKESKECLGAQILGMPNSK